MIIKEIRRSQIVKSNEVYRLLSNSQPIRNVTVIGDNVSAPVSWVPSKKLKEELWEKYEDNDNWKIFIGNDDNEMVATATLVIEDSLDSKKIGHITNVVVSNQRRNQGVGKQLIKYVVNAAKANGCGDVFLTCSNDKIPFYIKCGFGVREHCMGYGDND